MLLVFLPAEMRNLNGVCSCNVELPLFWGHHASDDRKLSRRTSGTHTYLTAAPT